MESRKTMPNGSSRILDTLRVAALLAVALAALYLGHSLHRATDTIGLLIEEVVHIRVQFDATSEWLQPVIVALPPALENLTAIREQVPDLLRELAGYRALVPAALAEVAAIRAEVPKVLATVEQIQQRVDALRADLPRVLELSEQAIETVRTTDAAVEKTLALIPGVLAEIQAIRKTLPPSLDRLDNILVDASQASQNAGRGMWRGLVRGMLSTPTDLLRDAEESLLSRFVYRDSASHEDFEYINETAAAVLDDEKHEAKSWVNPKNGNGGRVQILREFERDGVKCCRLDVTLEPKDGKSENFGKDVCLDTNGEWELLNAD